MPVINSNRLEGSVVSKRCELHALTGLRFFAAFWVVVFHFALDPLKAGPWALFNIAASGNVAVSLFFILSGFVLSFNYLPLDGAVRIESGRFWIKRFARIYPAYVAAFLLAAPISVLLSVERNSAPMAALKLLTGGTLVLAMLQAWTPWSVWYWNPPAWSISAEAFFYAVFPRTAARVGKWERAQCYRAVAVFWLLAMACPLIYCLYRWQAGLPLERDRIEVALEFTPLLRLPEFLMGMITGRIFTLNQRVHERMSGWLTLGSTAAILLILAYSSSIPRALLANGLLAPLFAALIYGLAHGRGWLAQFLSLKPLTTLGEASYSVYILQVPVSFWIKSREQYQSLVPFAGFSLVLVAVSLLCYRFVEHPMRPRIEQWLMSKLRRSRKNAEQKPVLRQTVNA